MTAYRRDFETGEQAVTEALFRALIAPDDGKAQAALGMCRAAALERWQAERR